jgi:hypothetical protein
MMRELLRIDYQLQQEADRLHVRFVALPSEPRRLAYLLHGWSLMDTGSYVAGDILYYAAPPV